MSRSFTRTYFLTYSWLPGVLLWLLPLLSWGQTTIVNYDFNSATAYPAAPATTAAGITSAATSTEAFNSATGISTGTGAFTPNASGPALGMNSYTGPNSRYFQFSLGGASLPKYSAFKLYLQGYRSTTATVTLTLQYSLNGSDYISIGDTYAPGNNSFTEAVFDLSGLTALNARNSLSFRLLTSTGTSGPLRIDNFEVQAVNTVDPVVGSLSPNTIEASSPGFPLTVGGSNFVSGAVVSFNGQALATTYNSPTSLTATVPATAITTAGSYNVVVTTPTIASSTASQPATFAVTPALLRWTGGAASSSWFDAANWSTGLVPTTSDDVLLDHRTISGSYTVSFDQNTPVSIKSLTVNPGVGDSIFVVVPATNTASTALTLSNTGAGNVALAIYNRGVVTNASGAASGSGVVVAGSSGATVFIYNGGSYRHASSRGHAEVVNNLSSVPGTEQGIFDFRLPVTGPASYTLSLSGRIYGTLILRNRPGQAASGYGGAGNSLTVQGDLLIGPGVTFSPALGGSLTLVGNVRSQGTLQFRNASPATTTSQLVLAGTKSQTLSGTVLLDTGIGLAINNPGGVVLATPLQVSGPLTLTNGTLTTSTTNLLTLTSTASLIGGSNTSFVNGSLARQTLTGALSNLVFPTGAGAFYRPVVLNATAQDATTYLVTPKQGVAPDPSNFLAGTTALPTLTRVSHSFYYTITPSAPNNFSGTITLPYGINDNVNQPNDASFTIGKNSNGAGWQNIGNVGVNVATPATATTGAVGTITSQPFNSFSDFALASTSSDATINPLPVTLTSFAAVRQASGAVHVRWATASEQHSARFEVQRSTDAATFATIVTEIAHGTTNQAHAYTSTDGAAPVSKLYYRLMEVDTDGSVQYSPVVALAATAAAATQMLYPNPTRNHLVVPAASGQQVQVLDLAGHQLQTVLLPPSGEVSVQELSAGTYLLRVMVEGQGRTFRFTKE